tara:strand:- start:3643 stop:3900 length:258 start_codon:yes stop_codon:yes gene_type:complete
MKVQKLIINGRDAKVGDFFAVTVCASNSRPLRREYREIVEVVNDVHQLVRKAKVNNGALIRTRNKTTKSLRFIDAPATVWREVKL